LFARPEDTRNNQMLVLGLACFFEKIVGQFIKQAKYEWAINFGGQVSKPPTFCFWQ